MRTPTRRVFPGWWVALGFSVMVFLSTGVRFTVGPFLKPIVSDLGLDRASFSLVVALSLFLYGAFMPLLGRLVDRVGVRPVIAGGALVLGASLVATAAATRLWHLHLWFGVLASLGIAATGHVVASAAIARWFTRRRATALSFLGGASMAGMSLFVPITTWLILALGWRTTYVVLGVGVVALLLPLAMVARESPEALGLRPDGEAWAPAAGGDATGDRTPVGKALQSLPFWQLAGGLMGCGFSMSLLAGHAVPMLTDHGYTPMVASWAFAVLGGTSMVFTFGLGIMADRIGRRPVLAAIYFARAAVLAGLFLVRDWPAALMLVAAVGGATMSGTLAATSALSADIFGRYSVGSVFGAIFLVHQSGAALGSWLGGALFEATGGYGAAFGLAGAMLVVSGTLSLTLDERGAAGPYLQPVAGGR